MTLLYTSPSQPSDVFGLLLVYFCVVLNSHEHKKKKIQKHTACFSASIWGTREPVGGWQVGTSICHRTVNRALFPALTLFALLISAIQL